MTRPEIVARVAIEEALHSAGLVDLSWLAPEQERDSWTMADDTLRFIAALVRTTRPRRIVEFGSGVSTLVLARASDELPEPATVIALENDPEFAPRTRTELGLAGLRNPAVVELTHLVVRRWYDRNVPVYVLPGEVTCGPPELVLVDGPPLPLGGREGSLLQAVHLGGPGTVILLDDATRPGERQALALADRLFGDAVDILALDGFSKGLAAIVLRYAVEGPAFPSVAGGGGQPVTLKEAAP